MTEAILSRRRLHQQMSDEILQQIVLGTYALGQRLPIESELAHQFRVSRTVVREALKTLEQRGVVEVRHGSGTFVTRPSPRMAGEALKLLFWNNKDRFEGLQEFREILEPPVAFRAAVGASETDIAAMRTTLAEMVPHVADRDAFITLDQDFHVAIARASGNPVIVAAIESTVEIQQDFRRLIFDYAGGPRGALEEHEAIFRAIIAHDPEAAQSAMLSHLRTAREKIGELVQRRARRDV